MLPFSVFLFVNKTDLETETLTSNNFSKISREIRLLAFIVSNSWAIV